MDLATPVSKADGKSFKLYAKRLEKIGIYTLGDFLYHIPSRYEDFSIISKISQLQPGEKITVLGVVESFKNEYLRSRKTIQKAVITDETGSITTTWFNQPYLSKLLTPKTMVYLSGNVNRFNNKINFTPNDFEVKSNQQLHTGRIIPIYPETHGVSSKWLRRQIFNLLNIFDTQFNEFLPPETLDRNSLMQFKTALWQIHFPSQMDDIPKARQRLAFNELLFMMLKSKIRKDAWSKNLKSNRLDIQKFNSKYNNFIKSLPFDLTSA